MLGVCYVAQSDVLCVGVGGSIGCMCVFAGMKVDVFLGVMCVRHVVSQSGLGAGSRIFRYLFVVWLGSLRP
jgi:hypothetical protein